jgi:hypothetical protein
MHQHLISMHRSGQSIFSRPKPIDITAARRAGLGIDLDIDEEDDEDPELGRPLVRNSVLFDAASEQRPAGSYTDMPSTAADRDTDVWAESG